MNIGAVTPAAHQLMDSPQDEMHTGASRVLTPNQTASLAWLKVTAVSGSETWERQYSHKSAKKPIRNDTIKSGFHIPVASTRPVLFMIWVDRACFILHLPKP